MISSFEVKLNLTSLLFTLQIFFLNVSTSSLSSQILNSSLFTCIAVILSVLAGLKTRRTRLLSSHVKYTLENFAKQTLLVKEMTKINMIFFK